MKLTAIHSAILLSLIPTTATFAAGLDRSGQSISAFLQPGNYAEAGFTIIDPTIEGTDLPPRGSNKSVSDMG
ncbi:long-chain fatty acid transport protein [Acinetobacter kyonggiensis]|uniref:Long-chain fatty acid transport protein n=1 Tax=Acinetobacter kyonggiensis TaxID=595670 RepID=A0A1H3INT5_9GAMM|nr:long-chain fatty acid transport protein [Acinetobacter kyonggiensis]